jgi:hypothetical protein
MMGRFAAAVFCELEELAEDRTRREFCRICDAR